MALPEGYTIDALPEGYQVDQPGNGDALYGLGAAGVSGVGSGAVGLMGLPGDVTTLVGHVARKAIEHVVPPTTTPEQRAKIEKDFWDEMNKGGAGVDVAQPMTSGDIQKGVEQVTGPFHEPQNKAESFVNTVGEFVPGALAGGEGIVTNLTKYGLLPGVSSEAMGQYFKGTSLEGPARFVGALFGGVAGMAGSKGVEAGKNYVAARSAASDIAEQTGADVNAGAVKRVAKDFEADRLTPDIVAARQQALGPEAIALDIGRQMQGRAEAIASQPGAGQNTVLDKVQARVHGSDPLTGLPNEAFGAESAARIKQTMDAQLGVSHDKVALMNGMSDIIDSKAKPLYQAVMDKYPIVNVPGDITSRPAVASAMKDAVELAKNYGEKLESPTETKTILQGPGYHIAEDVAQPAQTNLRYWDYVKKALDKRITGYMKSGGTTELSSADKADLGGLIDARNTLRNHLDAVTNGEYANARQIWSFKPDLTEAYDVGRSAFSSKLLPEEFKATLDDMSTPERVLAQAGYRRELENLIDTARNDGARARQLLDTNANQQKIENLFGPQARQAVEDRINAEIRFQTAANNVAGSSRTGMRAQLVKDTESPSVALPPMANIGGLALKGAGATAGYLRNQGIENTRAAIGRMSTMGGQDLTNLADVLSQYNAKRAANAASPVFKQAGGLARVLAINPTMLAAKPSLLAQPAQPQQ